DQPGSTASRRQEGARRTGRSQLTESKSDSNAPAQAGDVSMSAAYEDEKPTRELTGWVRHVVAAGCVLVGLFAVYQVFYPLAQGNQVSLILFLAAVLPLTLLCYRSGLRLRRRKSAAPQEQRDNPTPIDWLLALVALAACLYPVLPFEFADGGGGFDAFLSRQGMPATVDVIVGSV